MTRTLEEESFARWRHLASFAYYNLFDRQNDPIGDLAKKFQEHYGNLDEIRDGDELYPSELTWFMTAPK